jgi:hypothetical protein
MNDCVKEFLKDLNDSNIYKKVELLIGGIKGNYADSNQTELMFILHNRLFPNNQEYTKGCTACRERVYNRLLNYLKNK